MGPSILTFKVKAAQSRVSRVDAVTLVQLLLFCHRSLNRKKKGPRWRGCFHFWKHRTTRAIYGQLYMLTWIMAQQHGNFCQKQFREPHLSHHRTKQTGKQTKNHKKIQFSAFQFSLHCDAVYYQVVNCKKRKGINLHLRMILQLLFLVFCYVQGIIKSSKTNCTSTANMCTWGTVTFLFKALLLQYIAEKCNNRICVVTSVASYPHLSKSSFFSKNWKRWFLRQNLDFKVKKHQNNF